MSPPLPDHGARKRLPIKPSAEHLRKQAKRLAKHSAETLTQVQRRLARDYGAKSWEELMRMVETMLRGTDQTSDVKYEMEALPKAANASDLNRVRAVLASGAFTQHDLDLALARSVLRFGERAAIARLLLEYGADPDGQYGSDYGPIVFVTGECLDPDGLQFLIDAGADVTFEPQATKYGNQCPLSYFLGSYMRGQLEKKHQGIEILLRHGAFLPPEVTPAMLAIHRGDAPSLGKMLDADRGLLTRRFADMPYGNIELRGATLLHAAVEFGEIECMEQFLKRGADINMKADVIGGVGGQTPIFHAINTNCDGNYYTLEFLAGRVGEQLDLQVRANWRGNAGWAIVGFDPAVPLSPLEYSRVAVRDGDPRRLHNKPRGQEELALLESLATRPGK